MNYEQFKAEICRHIQQHLAPGASVQLHQIRKNNGLVLDGLAISTSQSNISPTIFLNYYYEKQNVFPDFDAICRDILLTYEHNKPTEFFHLDFFTDYELVKEHLAYRIVNYEKNKELLQTVPHLKYLDLAIVYYCLLKISENGSATILIHNSHLKLWNISSAELHQQACQMTPVLLPYDFCNMSSILSDAFGRDCAPAEDMAEDSPDPSADTCSPLENPFPAADSFCKMFVLTNSHKLYGAGCILYPGLLSCIADQLDADLLILPSSIHEVIILPAESFGRHAGLKDMVAEINHTELAADEVLSSSIYYYSRCRQALSIRS